MNFGEWWLMMIDEWRLMVDDWWVMIDDYDDGDDAAADDVEHDYW